MAHPRREPFSLNGGEHGSHRPEKKIERRCYALLSYLSPELNTRALFRRKFGRAAELEHPRTLNEKLLRLKLLLKKLNLNWLKKQIFLQILIKKI